MTVSYQIQARRERVFGAMLTAGALSLPLLGFVLMGGLAIFIAVVIFLRSEQIIKDLIFLVTFVACYAAATALSAYVFGIFLLQYELAYGIPVWPLSFYFVHKFEQRIGN